MFAIFQESFRFVFITKKKFSRKPLDEHFHKSILNPNKAELFEGRFFWEGPPPSYFKKNSCNINIILFNC